jgi:hypothetical protein
LYAWIWRRLPGPTAVRLLLALLLFAVAVFALFEYVFPWLDPQLPWNDVTVE